MILIGSISRRVLDRLLDEQIGSIARQREIEQRIRNILMMQSSSNVNDEQQHDETAVEQRCSDVSSTRKTHKVARLTISEQR